VVGELPFVGFVGAVVIHVPGPEAAVDFVTGHDLLRPFRQDQQVLEAGRLKLDRTASIEKVLLPFVHEDDRWIGDQFPEVIGIGQPTEDLAHPLDGAN
jgi:hypothetical protein